MHTFVKASQEEQALAASTRQLRQMGIDRTDEKFKPALCSITKAPYNWFYRAIQKQHPSRLQLELRFCFWRPIAMGNDGRTTEVC